jgi:hypothetical protein
MFEDGAALMRVNTALAACDGDGATTMNPRTTNAAARIGYSLGWAVP